MLSRFAGTVETFNDYECASRTSRHDSLSSVSVNIHGGHCKSFWVYEQLRRAGLDRYRAECAAALASTLH